MNPQYGHEDMRDVPPDHPVPVEPFQLRDKSVYVSIKAPSMNKCQVSRISLKKPPLEMRSEIGETLA
jgi:hypothetical protein